MKQRVIVTCGPAYEPIDEVRRITNFSTGDLGLRLANRLAREGFEVTCFIGVGATCGRKFVGVEAVGFTTNDRLRERLAAVANREGVSAIFHAAALSDFRVKNVAFADSAPGGSAKFSSRNGELTITLEPAKKLLGELRALFPRAAIAGWKYELDGRRSEALAKGLWQLEEHALELCVVNGAAYGAGFGVCARGVGEVKHVDTKDALCDWLAGWLVRIQSAPE